MNITLKLFADLTEYLPHGVDGNSITVAVPAASTPHTLLDAYNLPHGKARVLMVNGEFVPLEKRDAPLQEGDVMSVWSSIQGG